MALVLIKIIFQFFPRKILSWIVLPVCMVLHLYLGMNGFKSNNAYLNACGGFFFFMVGVWLQSRSCLSKKISTPYFLIGLILATAITLFVAIWNGKPGMHHNSWGNYYILFILGGLSGSVIVYLLSNRLSKWNSKALQLLSSGTIVILGLHMHFIRLYQIVIPFPSSIWDYLTAYLLLLLFIPIIQLIKNYFPVLMGKRLK